MNQVYYVSTSELPMHNWNLINKDHEENFKYLLKDPKNHLLGKKKALKLFDKPTEDIWNGVWIEYIDKHGLNEELDNWFRIMKEVTRLRLEVHLHKKTHLRAVYRAKEAEGEDILKSLQGGSPEETHALVNKYMGHRVNLKEVPVDEYLACVKIASNGKG